MNIENIMEKIELVLKREHQTNLCDATPQELHNALGSVVMGAIAEQWYESRHTHERVREAYYFSAEYLTGRMVYNNLFSLGLLEQVREAFASRAWIWRYLRKLRMLLWATAASAGWPPVFWILPQP